MWNIFKRTTLVQPVRADSSQVRLAAQPAPAGVPNCCGETMEPRLARARDRHGQTLFVAVWFCPKCGRTRL